MTASGVDWSVICISETWLKEELVQYFNLKCYNLVATCRSREEGGGTAIYVKKQLDYIRRSDLESDIFETTIIELEPLQNQGKNIIIGEIYKPPHICHNQLSEYIEKLLDTLETESKQVFLAGDFNYNMLSEDKKAKAFINLMSSYGLFPCITRHTRCQNSCHSSLDNIFINDCTLHKTAGVITDDLSDHFPIFLISTLNTKFLHPRANETVFDYQRIDEFNNFLTEKLADFQTCTDPDIACDWLIQAYEDGIHKYSKLVKQSRRSTPFKSWVTPAILCSINNKNKLYRKYIKSPTVKNENNYKRYRNLLTNILRDAKSHYFEQALLENKNNDKKTWQILNEVINTLKTKMIPGGR